MDFFSQQAETRRNQLTTGNQTGELNALLAGNIPITRSRQLELHRAEPRRSRFARGNCTESKLSETDQLRAKSAHSPRENLAQTMTRTGQITPARDVATLSDFRNETMHSRQGFRTKQTSHSPLKSNRHGPLCPEPESRVAQRAALSPYTKKRLTIIEKLQIKLHQKDEKLQGRPDPRLHLALEAVEYAFEEIAGFKEQCSELSKKYLKMTCAQI